MQRSFLGEIRTLRPCAACRGFGTIIPDPCRECSGDGRVRSRRTHHRQDPGRRRQRHPRPARRAGRGRPRRRPGRRPLRRDPRRRAPDLHPRTATTCTARSRVPMTAAALGTTLTLPTLEADVEPRRGLRASRPTFDLEIRPGTQSGTEQVLRGRGVPGLRGGRGDLVVTIVVETPDPARRRARRSCCASSPRSAARSSPTARSRPGDEVGLRPAPRRVQRALSTLMSLPVHLVAVAGRRRRRRRRSRSTGDEAHHAVAVRRLRVGRAGRADRRRRHVGHRRGRRDRQAGLRRSTVDVGRDVAGAPSPAVTVVQALPKGDRGELAVEVLTEVGVDRIVPWAAAALGRGLEGRAGGEVAGEVAGHRARGRQAVPPLVVPRGHRAGVDRRRRRRWSRAADLAVVLHEDADDAARRAGGPADGPRSWSSSAPRAGSPTRSWRAFAAAGAALGPPRRRGAAHLDRRRRRGGRALLARTAPLALSGPSTGAGPLAHAAGPVPGAGSVMVRV